MRRENPLRSFNESFRPKQGARSKSYAKSECWKDEVRIVRKNVNADMICDERRKKKEEELFREQNVGKPENSRTYVTSITFLASN